MHRAVSLVFLGYVAATGMQSTAPSTGGVEVATAITIDFATINSGATADSSAAMMGADPGDHITVARCPGLSADIGDLAPRITATDTVALQVRNFNEVSAIDPASCAFVFKVTKQ